MFYTSLYRALLFPRRLDEETPAGQMLRPVSRFWTFVALLHQGLQHWSPYSGQVVDGVGVSDNGFWDTFRTALASALNDMVDNLGDFWKVFSAYLHRVSVSAHLQTLQSTDEVYPFLSIGYPKMLAIILTGWLNAFKVTSNYTTVAWDLTEALWWAGSAGGWLAA